MKNSRPQTSVSYAILLLGAFLVLMPLYSIVAVSLQPGNATTGRGFELAKQSDIQPLRECVDHGELLALDR